MFSEQFEALQILLTGIIETIGESTKRIAELDQSVKGLHKEIASLKAKNEDLRQNQLDLKRENEDLRLQISSFDQYSRNRNVELHGIRYSGEENVKEVVQKVFRRMDLDVRDGSFISHRLTSKGWK